MITTLFICDKCDKEVRGEISSFYRITITHVNPEAMRELKSYDVCGDCNESFKTYMNIRPFKKDK
jgi:hypothetical protein